MIGCYSSSTTSASGAPDPAPASAPSSPEAALPATAATGGCRGLPPRNSQPTPKRPEPTPRRWCGRGGAVRLPPIPISLRPYAGDTGLPLRLRGPLWPAGRPCRPVQREARIVPGRGPGADPLRTPRLASDAPSGRSDGRSVRKSPKEPAPTGSGACPRRSGDAAAAGHKNIGAHRRETACIVRPPNGVRW